MKFLYDLIAGNSRITPFGVILAALAALALERSAFSGYTGAVFVIILLATLVAGTFERER